MFGLTIIRKSTLRSLKNEINVLKMNAEILEATELTALTQSLNLKIENESLKSQLERYKPRQGAGGKFVKKTVAAN